jgi:Uncharacterized protein conserved in bacteria
MDDKSAFEILNEEFSQHDLEMDNIRNLEMVRRRQAAQQAAKAAQQAEESRARDDDDDPEDDDSEEEKSGCFGIGFRILLIVLLAGALAWMIFMPAGSIGEARDLLKDKLSDAYDWAAGLLDGDSEGDSSGRQGDGGDVSSQQSDRASLDESTDRNSRASSDSQTPDSTDAQPGDYSITVYRPSQIVIVYDAAGNPARIFSCSSGKSSTPTRLGDYAIRAKYRWRFMIGDCYTQYASSFSSDYLFHSIPYNKKNAATMSNASYDKLGSPASSGCIRLCVRDTKWIYDNCPIGTKVKVIDEDAPSGSIPDIIPERIKDKAHNGWDPTDDSPDSPYNQ